MSGEPGLNEYLNQETRGRLASAVLEGVKEKMLREDGG